MTESMLLEIALDLTPYGAYSTEKSVREQVEALLLVHLPAQCQPRVLINDRA